MDNDRLDFITAATTSHPCCPIKPRVH